MSAGHPYGHMTPCSNEHSINCDPEHGERFWITCGDETIATATFAKSPPRFIDVQPRNWSERVMLLHEIDCWKHLLGDLSALLGDVRDWFDNPDGEPSSSDLLDRINGVLNT